LHQARERETRELRSGPRRERVDREQGDAEELGRDERADPRRAHAGDHHSLLAGVRSKGRRDDVRQEGSGDARAGDDREDPGGDLGVAERERHQEQ
jgi:hypothetical protein